VTGFRAIASDNPGNPKSSPKKNFLTAKYSGKKAEKNRFSRIACISRFLLVSILEWFLSLNVWFARRKAAGHTVAHEKKQPSG
jgi:hypothetical protein